MAMAPALGKAGAPTGAVSLELNKDGLPHSSSSAAMLVSMGDGLNSSCN